MITCACGVYTVEAVKLDRGRGAGAESLFRVRRRRGGRMVVEAELRSTDAVGALLAREGHGLDECAVPAG